MYKILTHSRNQFLKSNCTRAYTTQHVYDNISFSSSDEAFSTIKDNANVFVHTAAATPTLLLNQFYDYVIRKNIKNIKLFHIHTEGFYKPSLVEGKDHFRTNSFFVGENCRAATNDGRADYTPIFLSQIGNIFKYNHIKLDMALLCVTPPNKYGYCSLGPSVDVTKAAVRNASRVVAQLNPSLPLTYGNAFVHKNDVSAFILGDMPCHEMKIGVPSKEEDKIGSLISENLIEDGSTIQTGIGAIPDSVLSKLNKHKNLGVHTEMFSDGIVDLVECGAITNAHKTVCSGKIVTSFVIGTKKVFTFLHDNPLIELHECTWVNSPFIISQNPKPISINSCIEIDLTGQVSADSIGTKIYSGFGGQVDFIYGSSVSADGCGKPIIAFCSRTNKGMSKIVPQLKPGAGIVTTRAHVQYVVTEHGIANLFGRNLRQRAYDLIRIAHPDDREELEKAAHKNLKVMPSPD